MKIFLPALLTAVLIGFAQDPKPTPPPGPPPKRPAGTPGVKPAPKQGTHVPPPQQVSLPPVQSPPVQQQPAATPPPRLTFAELVDRTTIAFAEWQNAQLRFDETVMPSLKRVQEAPGNASEQASLCQANPLARLDELQRLALGWLDAKKELESAQLNSMMDAASSVRSYTESSLEIRNSAEISELNKSVETLRRQRRRIETAPGLDPDVRSRLLAELDSQAGVLDRQYRESVGARDALRSLRAARESQVEKLNALAAKSEASLRLIADERRNWLSLYAIYSRQLTEICRLK